MATLSSGFDAYHVHEEGDDLVMLRLRSGELVRLFRYEAKDLATRIGEAYNRAQDIHNDSSEIPSCPKCSSTMRECSSGEPDWHCDACGHVEPWSP
jgi:hypothetical protein